MTPNAHPDRPTLTRRDFLKTGPAAAGAATLTAAGVTAAPTVPASFRPTADACIFINLVGGPSQLDTWDPKPGAPSDVRGPFRPIPTRVPGVHVTELFPKIAAMADRFSLIRGMNHTAAPIHETGLQLLNTGKLFRDGPEWPNVGAVIGTRFEPRGHSTPWWMLPSPDVNTGVNVSRGQGTGFLGTASHWPMNCERAGPGYAKGGFGTWCRDAVQIVETGGRFITINMFPTVFDAPSWDCHADRGSLATDLNDYCDTVAPMFDTAFTQLLADLETRGLLERTLVVATGEFGRTPRLNSNGGRDHWPSCWTAIVAGGGVKGGRMIGASDATASEPKDRPVSPQEFVATIYHAFGIPPETTIPGPAGTPVPVVDAPPVLELF